MLNLLMLSLEETLLQLTKSLIHIGKHAAMNMKMCLYYPCSSCITNAAINMKLYFYYPCIPVLLMMSFYTSLQITHGILMHWE